LVAAQVAVVGITLQVIIPAVLAAVLVDFVLQLD